MELAVVEADDGEEVAEDEDDDEEVEAALLGTVKWRAEAESHQRNWKRRGRIRTT